MYLSIPCLWLSLLLSTIIYLRKEFFNTVCVKTVLQNKMFRKMGACICVCMLTHAHAQRSTLALPTSRDPCSNHNKVRKGLNHHIHFGGGWFRGSPAYSMGVFNLRILWPLVCNQQAFHDGLGYVYTAIRGVTAAPVAIPKLARSKPQSHLWLDCG